MIAKPIDKSVKIHLPSSGRVYLAKIITARGSEIEFTILAQNLESALTIVKAHESYGYADSLSIEPRQGHFFIAVDDEVKE